MSNNAPDYHDNLAFEPRVIEIHDSLGTSHDQPKKIPTWYELAYLWQEENPKITSDQIIAKICKILETSKTRAELLSELYYHSIGLTIAAWKESGLKQEAIDSSLAKLYARRMAKVHKSE